MKKKIEKFPRFYYLKNKQIVQVNRIFGNNMSCYVFQYLSPFFLNPLDSREINILYQSDCVNKNHTVNVCIDEIYCKALILQLHNKYYITPILHTV